MKNGLYSSPIEEGEFAACCGQVLRDLKNKDFEVKEG